jgi:hypothetical protein
MRRPRFPSRIAALAAIGLAAVTLGLVACGDDDSGSTTTASTTTDVIGGCEIGPGADCTGADLSGADLTGVNLAGADLTEADLSGADLTDADLAGADLTGTNLTGATLDGTDLNGATICGTIRTDGSVDDRDCPPSGGTTTEATTTVTTEATTTAGTTTAPPPGGTPIIETFDVPATAECPAGSDTAEVEVSWVATGADGVELSVDGEAPGASAGYGAEGDARLAVPCDGAAHVIGLDAFNAAGQTSSTERTVTT